MRLTSKRLQPILLSGVLIALLLAGAACTAGQEAQPDTSEPVRFPDTPPDGPAPEIGPAPDSYRPTAAGAPSTDIWVGQLIRSDNGVAIVDLFNATDRDGYDNQPSFEPASSGFLYVSAIDARQTEVMRFDLQAGTSTIVTRTDDTSEFSPQMIPGQDAFSAIHEMRGRQHLWRYDSHGAKLGAIFATAEPVGYQAWVDSRKVAMFILGDGQSPSTLQIGDAISGRLRVVASNPGRSIHRIPGSTHISFVQKDPQGEWWITQVDPATGEFTRLVRTLPGREDYAWTPEGEILMGDGARLFLWRPGEEWTLQHDAGRQGVTGISRLAVSPDGETLAMVARRPAED